MSIPIEVLGTHSPSGSCGRELGLECSEGASALEQLWTGKKKSRGQEGTERNYLQVFDAPVNLGQNISWGGRRPPVCSTV